MTSPLKNQDFFIPRRLIRFNQPFAGFKLHLALSVTATFVRVAKKGRLEERKKEERKRERKKQRETERKEVRKTGREG